MKKKIISLLMAVAMVMALLPGAAFATDGAVKVTFSYSSGNALVVAPTELSVTAGLAAAYGVGTATSEPTVLDAVVAAHVKKYGDAFTPATSSDYVDSSLSKAFGQSGYTLIPS